MRTRDILSAIKAIDKAINKVNIMNKKYPTMYKEELERIGEHIITEWYSDYDPILYDRYGGLYKAFVVRLQGTKYSVHFGASLMNDVYHQSTNWIFKNSFIEGWHGGSRHNGIPYWRTPHPEYTDWGRPAIRSFSPYYKMVNEMNKKIREIDKIKQDEFDEVIKKVKKSIYRLVK